MKLHTLTAILIASLATFSTQAVEKASEKRLDEVVERGSHVMPFDLEQTTHVFSKTEQGGLQQVVVKDQKNSEQIKLIRQHLSKISSEFKKGDFSNPAKIHGKDMPGLEVLRNTKPEQLKIDYKELPNGAEINYASDEKNVIDAIHQFLMRNLVTMPSMQFQVMPIITSISNKVA
jgi:hypothetical protein